MSARRARRGARGPRHWFPQDPHSAAPVQCQGNRGGVSRRAPCVSRALDRRRVGAERARDSRSRSRSRVLVTVGHTRELSLYCDVFACRAGAPPRAPSRTLRRVRRTTTMSSRRVQCRRTNASWLLRRALLMPQVKPGPSYRCGKSTFKRAACTPRLGRKRGPEIGHQSPAAQPSPYMYSAYSTYTIVHTQYRPCTGSIGGQDCAPFSYTPFYEH